MKNEDYKKPIKQLALEVAEAQAAMEWMKHKKELEGSLKAFTIEAWQEVVEPGTMLIWNWHLDVICGYLEALADGRIKRLIFNVAPGSMKSLLVSVMYPAWKWIKRPDIRFLAGTNGDDLAIRDALKMKNLVWSEWYQDRWRLKVNPSQNEKSLFLNTRGGHRQSIGITANVTGKRGDCVSGETLISTEVGEIRIDELIGMEAKPKVWTFNYETKKIELKEILATKRSIGKTIISIGTSSGKLLNCTKNHKIFSEYGYYPAICIDGRWLSELQWKDSKPEIKKTLAKIKNIEKFHHHHEEKGKYVYDLQIDGNHNFFANGILCHNCVLMDDPHDAKKAMGDAELTSVRTSWDQAWSNRLNDPQDSTICIIMQRLHQQDLTGHLMGKSSTDWIVVRIPMEYEGQPGFDAGRDIGRPDLIDPRKEIGELMFPKRFGQKFIKAEKEDKGEYGYAGQYQQRPIPMGGGILKSYWWKRWPEDKPLPEFEHIFYSWDTAFTEKDRKTGAYSVFLKFGIFFDEIERRFAMMVLKRWHKQADYSDLREMAKSENEDSHPHCHFIERKASGISMIQDLRRAGIKVRSVIPDIDKEARAYIESSLLKDGLIYAPQRKWADEVIDLISKFPNGAPPSADYTDAFTQAIKYLRKGWWLRHPDDDLPQVETKINPDDEFYIDKTKSRPRAYGAAN